MGTSGAGLDCPSLRRNDVITAAGSLRKVRKSASHLCTLSGVIRFAFARRLVPTSERVLGSFEVCAAIANRHDHSSLDHLRACLFFEVRRACHCDDDLGPKTLAYWHELVRYVRSGSWWRLERPEQAPVATGPRFPGGPDRQRSLSWRRARSASSSGWLFRRLTRASSKSLIAAASAEQGSVCGEIGWTGASDMTRFCRCSEASLGSTAG